MAALADQVGRLGGSVPKGAKRAFVADLAKALVRLQDGAPSDAWTTGMLEAYAKSRGVAGGRRNKSDLLAALRKL